MMPTFSTSQWEVIERKFARQRIAINALRARVLRVAPLRNSDITRVSGEAPCGICGTRYDNHPEIEATFHVSCDGRVVKT